jgi:hypothetical protein
MNYPYNQDPHGWDGVCQECKNYSVSWTMSTFSTKLICWICKDTEHRYSDYPDERVKPDTPHEGR